ncbi:family 20 glycosylhydrolase [Hoylesella enoeca]|uniref:beta-N-acetylhexosaminidase n=1 Tax=Hoylesella enoeca TaxID=76123 RepID=A0A0S2KKC8_9BACT|nr:family 20 glycosylhydrolase [Hoylesella enoeca]ALO48745.1 beta-N-acetylhexosaminidase [Hoylesella enoeca]
MNHFRLLLIAALLTLCLSHSEAEINVVPVPQQVEYGNGYYRFGTTIRISYADHSLEPASAYLGHHLTQLLKRKVVTVYNRKGDIRLSLDKNQPKDGYRLTIDKTGIDVHGNDYCGVISAIATIRQLAFEKQLPYVRITDAPRFEWRGFMLDCSRHFFSKAEVEELIDLMALYKLDRFHWHLTDDQGWRIEIKRYPLLTNRGAWRKYNNQDRVCLNRAAQEDNPDLLLPASKKRVEGTDTLYGGYYTQADVREIVAYAKQRGIEVVPEVDMPGHFLSAVSNYPGLSCFDTVGWGKTFSSPICPGKDSALEFCRHVWEELFELFPYEYVHIGGDEVEKDNWKKCPDCQRRIKEEGLRNEEELQSWFIHQMENYLNANGKKMIGWDEIMEGGLSKTATVTWWRTWAPRVVNDVTAQGNDVIYCPNAEMYVDYPEQKTSVEKIYKYDLLPQTLTSAQKAHVKGVQANLWTEWVPSRNQMLYMYFPRMIALAELGWSRSERMDYADFSRRLRYQFDILNRMNIPYRIPDLDGFPNLTAFTTQGTLHVSCADPTATVRYTTDGSFPSVKSPQITGAITVDETTHFILRPFGQNGRAGEMIKADFVKQGYLEPISVQSDLQQGLKADWHEFSGVTCKHIGKAPLNASYQINDVEIPAGVKGNIGLIINGYIKIPTDGIYTFSLLSDDGSWLKVDGNMVVNQDREQSPHEEVCQQALRAGFHKFEVRYFDHNGGQLRLHVYDQDGKRLNPSDLYFHVK